MNELLAALGDLFQTFPFAWIVLIFIGIILGFISLITWIPVLVNGRTADWVVRWVGGFYRWFNRVYAYQLLLTSKYPPFRIDD